MSPKPSGKASPSSPAMRVAYGSRFEMARPATWHRPRMSSPKERCNCSTNPAEGERLGNAAKEHVRENYLITRLLRDYLTVFNQLDNNV